MRNQLRIVGLLAVVLMAVSASGQTAPESATPAVPILQVAARPVHPPIAKAAHITGKVIVRVAVKDGLVAKTDVPKGPAAVERGIKSFEELISEHEGKIANATGHTSSMEREINNFKQLLQAYKQVLGGH
jgi:hypothetical protein